MKININDIPDAGLSLQLSEDGGNLEKLAGGKLEFEFLSPVDANLDITRTGLNIFISGVLRTKLRLNCGRCLKEFDYDVQSDLALFYTIESEQEKEKELKPADMDVNYIQGEEIDTDEVLLAQLALEVPMQPLCTPECKGLCPKCGADLNLGPCGCGEKEKVDPRFAELKKFKGK